MRRPILRPASQLRRAPRQRARFAVAAFAALTTVGVVAACASAPAEPPQGSSPRPPGSNPTDGKPVDGKPTGGGPAGGAPPQIAPIRDGLGEDVDVQATDSAVFGNWDRFVDPEGGPVVYEWSIGTTRGGCEVLPWTKVGGANRSAVTGLALGDRTVVYVSVRGTDVGGNVSAVAHSDGMTIQLGPTPG